MKPENERILMEKIGTYHNIHRDSSQYFNEDTPLIVYTLYISFEIEEQMLNKYRRSEWIKKLQVYVSLTGTQLTDKTFQTFKET